MSAAPNATRAITIDCPRCSAAGSILAFAHVAAGRCFLCGGARSIDVAAGSVEAVNAGVAARAAAETDSRNAWVERIGAGSTVSTLAALRNLSADRLHAIREWTAGRGADQPVAFRRVYWSTSTILGAWPGRTAYPESWIDG